MGPHGGACGPCARWINLLGLRSYIAQELNNWAVMNLSMEDRGLLEPGAQAQQPAGGRYLSGDIRCAVCVNSVCFLMSCAHARSAAAVMHSQAGLKNQTYLLYQNAHGYAPRPQLLWRRLQERRLLPGPHRQGGHAPRGRQPRARALHSGWVWAAVAVFGHATLCLLLLLPALRRLQHVADPLTILQLKPQNHQHPP